MSLIWTFLSFLAWTTNDVLSFGNECSSPEQNYLLIGKILSLEQTIADMKQELENVRSQYQQLRLDCHCASGQTFQMLPAFTVKQYKSANYPQNATIVFDDVLLNDNNSYNTTTGKFTTTVHGRYLFSVTARAPYGKSCHPGIFINGINEVNAMSGADTSEWSSSGSTSIVLDLDVGDEVYAGESWTDGDYHEAFFTGVMLYPF